MQNRDATPSSARRDNQEMGSRSTRRVRGLLALAIFAFPVWMALAPSPASAAAVGSSATNANIPLPAGGAWTTLNVINVPAANVVRYCTAVGSADIKRALGSYLFTLVLDDPQPPTNLGQERTVQFVAGDPRIKEVTTTQGFTLPAGAHVIYWLGRPAGANPTVALDNSMTAVCDVRTLGVINLNPEATPDIED